MLLIAYDGSADAKAAIQHAGKLMPKYRRNRAHDLGAVYDDAGQNAGNAPAAGAGGRRRGDRPRVGSTLPRSPRRRGCELARAAGLDATPFSTPLNGSIADTIIAQADRLDVDAIVVGSRGLTGMALLLGSVSLAVVQRADRTVVVVPSADVAKQRQTKLDQ